MAIHVCHLCKAKADRFWGKRLCFLSFNAQSPCSEVQGMAAPLLSALVSLCFAAMISCADVGILSPSYAPPLECSGPSWK